MDLIFEKVFLDPAPDMDEDPEDLSAQYEEPNKDVVSCVSWFNSGEVWIQHGSPGRQETRGNLKNQTVARSDEEATIGWYL